MVEYIHLLEDHLKRTGLKTTQQRRDIVQEFFATDAHVTAEELHHRLRAAGQRVGMATVYRTLSVLCQAGLAVERHFGDGSVRYEQAYGKGHHDHMQCVRCAKIIEFANPFSERLQQEALLRHGFLVHSHRLQLQGLCRECRENE